MTYLDTWRSNLKTHLIEFASLAKEDRSINPIYGITAAAVLWGVRDAPFDDEQKAALKEAGGDEKHLSHLMRAIGGWDTMTPLDAAQNLNKRQRESEELREALTALIGTFIEDLFDQHMLQRQHINISGTITGGNIVIGGYQIFAGDMVTQYITQQKIRACPTAPKPPAHFAGRRDELNRLKKVLGQGQSVAITGIQGVGGIGKTALSLQLASEMNQFSAVLWASLGPNPNIGNQLIEWARHADPDFDPSQDDLNILVSRVQALLSNLIQEQCPGRVLVILDDIWEGESVQTARILQNAAPVNSVSLITTRSQLVVAQLRSTRLELQPMTSSDALQMLRNLLSDYSDIPDDKLLELAEVVGYHPLAMELAAGQVSLLERPTQEIGEQIERYRGGIPEGSPFRDIGLELGEAREDNLEVVLSFSYASLTKTEQAQFRALGVLAYNAPFDREICRAIWKINDSKAALDGLRHRALLGIAEGKGWYQQHVLLRSYATALLKTYPIEQDVVWGHYSDHIIELGGQFFGLPVEKWKTILEYYYSHIIHVGDELVKMWKNSTLIYAYRANDFALFSTRLLRHRREIHRMEWLEMGLETTYFIRNKADTGDIADFQRLESLFLTAIGSISLIEGDPQKALNAYEKCLNLDRILNDDEGEAIALNNIGSVLDNTGRPSEALEYFKKALVLYRNVGSKGGEAIVLNNLGTACDALGKTREAIKYYEQVLLLCRSINERAGEAATLNNISTAWLALRNPQKALEACEQSLALRHMVDDQRGMAITLNNFGQVWQQLNDNHKAHEYYEQALSLSRLVRDTHTEALVLNNFGGVYLSFGEPQKALKVLEQALELRRKINDKNGEAITTLRIGHVREHLNDNRAALNLYEQALSLLREVNDRRGEADAFQSIGTVRNKSGDKRKSLIAFEQALSIYQTLQDEYGEAYIKNQIGTIYDYSGDKRKALTLYEQALPIFRKTKDKKNEAQVLHNIAGVFYSLGRSKEAIKIFNQALELRQAIGDRIGEAATLYNMGIYYLNEGKTHKGIFHLEKAIASTSAQDPNQQMYLNTLARLKPR